MKFNILGVFPGIAFCAMPLVNVIIYSASVLRAS